MDREGGNKGNREGGNVESKSLFIFSFPLLFLILSPFPRSQAARLPQFVQPCPQNDSIQSLSFGKN